MTTPHPSIALKNAVSSLRIMGTLFILLGASFDLLLIKSARIGSQEFELIASASLCLLAPGMIYHISAAFIQRYDVKMALLARRTAIVQSIVGLVGVSGLVFFTPGGAPPFLYGCVPILFFVPALLVQAHQIGTALHTLRTLPQAQRGFEVLAVLPIESTSAEPVITAMAVESISDGASGEDQA